MCDPPVESGRTSGNVDVHVTVVHVLAVLLHHITSA